MTRPPAPFIVGTGRCGTTLLRLMLDSHPHLTIPPETHFIPNAASERFVSDPVGAFLARVFDSPFWGDNHLSKEELSRRVRTLQPFDLGEALRAFYALYAESQSKPRWGDKTPIYVLHMCTIQDLLPEAQFIHLIRDGRDVTLSFDGLWFGPQTVEAAAKRWVSWIEEARAQAAKLQGYMEVRYEDLVAAPESTLMRICAAIDLPWDPAMLDYHHSAGARIDEMVQAYRTQRGTIIGPEQRKALHALASTPLRKDRVGRWKSEMNFRDRERFEKIAAPLLRELGYEQTGSMS
jgi:hypothetical protein